MKATTRRVVGIIALLCYIGTIFAANWSVNHFGSVPVGFGLSAPAGVYFAGIAFTFRDLVQNILGRWISLAAIVVGAGLSAFVSPVFALASGTAFFCSELSDFVVYTPLLRRGWIRALIPANLVGSVVDSIIFLSLAFGSLAHLPGQVLAKTWMTALSVALLGPIRHWYALVPEPEADAQMAAVA